MASIIKREAARGGANPRFYRWNASAPACEVPGPAREWDRRRYYVVSPATVCVGASAGQAARMSDSASVRSSRVRARHEQALLNARNRMQAMSAIRLAQQAAVLRQEACQAMARQLEQEVATRMEILRLRAEIDDRNARDSGRLTPSHTKEARRRAPEVAPVENGHRDLGASLATMV